MSVDWAKCGTEANARAHYRAGEKPCERCRAAQREGQRQRRAERIAVLGRETQAPMRPEDHGTPWGMKGHSRRGEPACEVCLLAHREALKRYRSTGSYVAVKA